MGMDGGNVRFDMAIDREQIQPAVQIVYGPAAGHSDTAITGRLARGFAPFDAAGAQAATLRTIPNPRPIPGFLMAAWLVDSSGMTGDPPDDIR